MRRHLLRYISYITGLMVCMAVFSCRDHDESDSQAQEEMSNIIPDDSYEYELPVIFHILYKDRNDSRQYIASAHLNALVGYLNELYKGGIYGESEDVKVRFVMASHDENGQKLSTPGIEYTQYSGEYPIDPTEFMSKPTNKKYIWNPNKYINVMLYHFKETDDSGTLLGISHMPYAPSDIEPLEGLERIHATSVKKEDLTYAHCSSINSLYVSELSTRYTQSDKGRQGYTYNSQDIVLTIAHELGHYLGLYHTFSEGRVEGGFQPLDECKDTDYCTDTPSYNLNEYNEYLSNYLQHPPSEGIDLNELLYRTNCEGDRFESVNIMDYAVGLGFHISREQRDRIRWVLYHSPLIPGPKKPSSITSSTRSSGSSEDTPIKFPIRIIR